MSVTVRIPTPLRRVTNGQDKVTAEGSNLGEVVGSLDAALEHIAEHGSGHSEAIVTSSYEASQRFQREVDAAAVFVNASTYFHDGGQFGLGSEIGISTQKMHARGPMGLRELTSYKWIVLGDGHIRS